MILVDTTIWIDHLGTMDEKLAELLKQNKVVGHPFVLGELALGNLRQRDLVVRDYGKLPRATMASDSEVLRLIGENGLAGSGVGYVDAHLLAAARLTADCLLWTRDKRLNAVATRLNLAARIVH